MAKQVTFLVDKNRVEKIDIKDKKLLKKIDALEDLISALDAKGKLPKGSIFEQLRDV